MASPRQIDWLAPPGERKGNRYSEFKLQCAVASTIRQFLNPKWRAVHLPFGEHRKPSTAGRLKRMGVEPGWPDWLLVGPGKVCFLELKRGNGKPSPEQEAIATHLVLVWLRLQHRLVVQPRDPGAEELGRAADDHSSAIGAGMSRWFRFYDDVITDPKVMQLGVAMRWHWVLALCCASKSQGVVSTRAIALALHVRHKRAQQIIDKLVAVKLFDKIENSDTYTPHNWKGRQYKGDLSTDRVKRFRAVSETAPEQSRADTERERSFNNNIKTSFSCKTSPFSIKPGMPEWEAWERYSKEHKKQPALDLAMERVREGQQKTITVAVRLPEEIDKGYAAALELKKKLDEKA